VKKRGRDRGGDRWTIFNIRAKINDRTWVDVEKKKAMGGGEFAVCRSCKEEKKGETNKTEEIEV